MASVLRERSESRVRPLAMSRFMRCCSSMTRVMILIALARSFLRMASDAAASSILMKSSTLSFPALSSVTSLRISLSVRSARKSAAMTTRSPSSMRFAIVTSPSRVRSGTLPISRRYMRTGSS